MEKISVGGNSPIEDAESFLPTSGNADEQIDALTQEVSEYKERSFQASGQEAMPVDVELSFLRQLAPLYKKMGEVLEAEGVILKQELSVIEAIGDKAAIKAKVDEIIQTKKNETNFYRKFSLAQIRISEIELKEEFFLDTSGLIQRKREEMRRLSPDQPQPATAVPYETQRSPAEESIIPISIEGLVQIEIEIAAQESLARELSSVNRQKELETLASLKDKKARLENEVMNSEPVSSLDPKSLRDAKMAILRVQAKSATNRIYGQAAERKLRQLEDEVRKEEADRANAEAFQEQLRATAANKAMYGVSDSGNPPSAGHSLGNKFGVIPNNDLWATNPNSDKKRYQ